MPEEVIFCYLSRRHVRMEALADTEAEQRYRLLFEGLNQRVLQRELTFEVNVPAAWCRFPQVWVNGVPQPAELVKPCLLGITVTVTEGMTLRFGTPA